MKWSASVECGRIFVINVFNDEFLYNQDRRGSRDYVITLIDESFIYTDEQMDVLIQDLDEDE